MSEQSYPSYLIHYGIEGQKWGVRRFQNEDGTYTDEGLRRRYSLNEKKANKLAKLYDKSPEKFSKAVGKLKAVKAYKQDNPYEKKYSATTRKKWVTDMDEEAKSLAVGNITKAKMLKNNSDFFIGKAKRIYSKEEIEKEFEKSVDRYLKSDIVNKKYNQLEKELNDSYNEYSRVGKKFTNSILGEYGNIKLKDGNTLSEKFAEEMMKNRRGKSYKSPSNLYPRPTTSSVLKNKKEQEEYEKWKQEHGY